MKFLLGSGGASFLSLVDRGSGGVSFDGVDTDTAFALGELGGLNTFSTF